MEIAKGSFGDNMLTAEEYFWHRLPSLDLDAEELGCFAGRKRAGSTNFLCNSQRWVAVCADKIIYLATLRGMGFPVPDLAAIAHPTRPHRTITTLRNAEELAEYLRTKAPYPVFTKPLGGEQSIGAASLAGYHADTDELEDLYGKRFALDAFVAELKPFLADGYLIQPRLNPHPDVAAHCGPALSTFRTVVMQDENGAEILDVAFKMTVHGQVADNFWRGNLLGGVRLEDGKVERVVNAPGTKGKRVAKHPDTGMELVGWHLPDWDLFKETVIDATLALPGLGLIGWDVALTDKGPVLVEANVGGNWAMVQLAAARGLWRPRLRTLARERLKVWKATKNKREMDVG
ncbi:MAG: sugar-transfer associated ATP-grasp domain-containing protein, partial [Myxococcota bacterium]